MGDVVQLDALLVLPSKDHSKSCSPLHSCRPSALGARLALAPYRTSGLLLFVLSSTKTGCCASEAVILPLVLFPDVSLRYSGSLSSRRCSVARHTDAQTRCWSLIYMALASLWLYWGVSSPRSYAVSDFPLSPRSG
ncbi:hypothetical protein PYCCODRAFT_1005129 [Trametes coccinea BRFM310]|uniref:Uncharacterized protein n=1 Tax=Trametes coccinea (strain BRFM310) TaxID=1353009 RepID=A0A1Y2IB27_TRAC3|nr:hypothetical protein PYCCODRAFT_1005129 [Trametes coccinea BRFM310]